MNNKEQKKIINKIIKKLKEIRDTEEIEDFIIRGNENIESLICENEFDYVTLKTIIEIKSKKLFKVRKEF